jgi:hypothetical protein
MVLGASFLALLSTACGPGRAVEDLEGGVLFYAWTHGDSLSDQPEQVAEQRRRQLRSLREIEDFAGTLDEWIARSGPVERVHVGPDDYALGHNLFFYYLASLRHPAVAEALELRITRTGPDGVETLDLATQETAQVNRAAQSGGLLYSMAGLAAGFHKLHLEVLDGEEVVASGDLWVEHAPGPEAASAEREGTS